MKLPSATGPNIYVFQKNKSALLKKVHLKIAATYLALTAVSLHILFPLTLSEDYSFSYRPSKVRASKVSHRRDENKIDHLLQ